MIAWPGGQAPGSVGVAADPSPGPFSRPCLIRQPMRSLSPGSTANCPSTSSEIAGSRLVGSVLHRRPRSVRSDRSGGRARLRGRRLDRRIVKWMVPVDRTSGDEFLSRPGSHHQSCPLTAEVGRASDDDSPLTDGAMLVWSRWRDRRSLPQPRPCTPQPVHSHLTMMADQPHRFTGTTHTRSATPERWITSALWRGSTAKPSRSRSARRGRRSIPTPTGMVGWVRSSTG
jgi:hypothetical protein